MNDLISRNWVVECVKEGWIRFDTEKDYNRVIHLVRDMAPPVKPERKKGKWITINKYGIVVCSECNREAPKIMTGIVDRHLEYDKSDYCWHCGADMRERV